MVLSLIPDEITIDFVVNKFCQSEMIRHPKTLWRHQKRVWWRWAKGQPGSLPAGRRQWVPGPHQTEGGMYVKDCSPCGLTMHVKGRPGAAFYILGDCRGPEILSIEIWNRQNYLQNFLTHRATYPADNMQYLYWTLTGGFLPWKCTVLQGLSVRTSVRLSVCPSAKCVDCDKKKQSFV